MKNAPYFPQKSTKKSDVKAGADECFLIVTFISAVISGEMWIVRYKAL